MNVRALCLLSVAPALLLGSAAAQAGVRPAGVAFEAAAVSPLVGSPSRKSMNVAADNRLDTTQGVITGLAIIVAALGLYFAVGQQDRNISAF